MNTYKMLSYMMHLSIRIIKNNTGVEKTTQLCLTEYVKERNSAIIPGGILLLYLLYGSTTHINELLSKQQLSLFLLITIHIGWHLAMT